MLKLVFFDFNLGYVVMVLFVLLFLGLGVLILYGSGIELSISGIGFFY